jgi:hypothetical protein
MRTKRKGLTPEAQHEIPGVLPVILKLPALTRACRRLESQRTALGEMRLEMGETKESIEKQMIEADITEYPYDGGVVVRKPGKTVILIKRGGKTTGEVSESDVDDED